jgi:hypothetical protein
VHSTRPRGSRRPDSRRDDFALQNARASSFNLRINEMIRGVEISSNSVGRPVGSTIFDADFERMLIFFAERQHFLPEEMNLSNRATFPEISREMYFVLTDMQNKLFETGCLIGSKPNDSSLQTVRGC